MMAAPATSAQVGPPLTMQRVLTGGDEEGARGLPVVLQVLGRWGLQRGQVGKDSLVLVESRHRPAGTAIGPAVVCTRRQRQNGKVGAAWPRFWPG